MRINHNIPALNAHRMLNRNANVSTKVLERLSSGKKINRASDDAAGMAISEKMRAQVNGLKMASRNALDGISLIQTAEGATGEVHAILQRMRELAVQAANEIYENEDIQAIQREVNELIDEIDRIADHVQFNGKLICQGSGVGNKSGTIILQIGANSGETLELRLVDVRVEKFGGLSGLKISGTKIENMKGASGIVGSGAIGIIDDAIARVSEQRSILGATQNRLEHTIANLDNTAENLSAALSRIEDTDMALEMSEFTKYNILIQAGTAMLAQANQRPQSVLQLLGG